jgi:hypothetical protein
MYLLHSFRLFFYVLLSTQRCFVQGETSANPLQQKVERLEEASGNRHSQGLKATRAADKAHDEAQDDNFIGFYGKSLQAVHRAAEEERTAAKDFQVAKEDELQSKEAMAVIKGPSSESETPKAQEAQEPLFKKSIHEAQARTHSKFRSNKSTSDASPADVQAINHLIIVTVAAGLGFLAWRFIQKKTKKARDSDLDAFKESLLNPSQEQTINCKPNKDVTKVVNIDDTDSTNSIGSFTNHSGNAESAAYIGTPRSNYSEVPEEITLERDFSICKTYDEHIQSLTPREPLGEKKSQEHDEEPSQRVPTTLPPKAIVTVIRPEIPKLVIPQSQTVMNLKAAESILVANAVVYGPNLPQPQGSNDESTMVASRVMYYENLSPRDPPNHEVARPPFVKTLRNDQRNGSS